MAIISEIGRKDTKTRMLIASIYAVLTLGSITMVYPFLLMISGSTKSGVDSNQSHIIPRYLISDEALYRKHIERLFNERYNTLKIAYNNEEHSFRELPLPTFDHPKLVEQWDQFVADPNSNIPHYSYNLGYFHAPVSHRVIPKLLSEFRDHVKRTISYDILQVNAQLETIFSNWNTFEVVPRPFLLRGNLPNNDKFSQTYQAFKVQQNKKWRTYLSTQGMFRNYLKNQYIKIENYNKTHDTQYTSFHAIPVVRSITQIPRDKLLQRNEWETFVRFILSHLWLEASDDASPAYRGYLKAKYVTIEHYNRSYETQLTGFDSISIPRRIFQRGVAAADWNSFLQGWEDPETGTKHIIDIEHISLHGIDYDFIDFLRNQYPSLVDLNQAMETHFKSWSQISIPQKEAHLRDFHQQKAWLRWNFTIRNYINVLEYLVFHGRGLYNTVIYCALSVLSALIVNPLAAYALSRFKPPSQYKILLFLMITMAFPPMVTQIPVFLQLRSFGMLNTFFALILPTLANGYSIFLLKGFFDSLPSELIESAQIDGAGELTIFWSITIALSKPILAVVALTAFNQAYSAFMFALLTCQDNQMWTIMVWLFQLQQHSSQGIIFASLLIAAIPTLAVFIFCQNIIIRGIVVPVEK